MMAVSGANKAPAPTSVSDFYKKIKMEVGIDDPRPIPYIIPTGSIGLNNALYVGGYPGGRIVEIYGPEHSGKTTLAMHACIEAQKMGLIFAYIDMECTLDLDYFRRMGVKGEPNVDWYHITPDTGEDAFTVSHRLIDAGAKLIVIDSVAAMTPKAEIEGDMGEAFMGLQARMMSQGMRKSVGPSSRADVTMIFINQIRMKIGVVFGSPETTPGGNALKFYASVRLDIRQVGDAIEEDKGDQIGQFSRVTVKKNKVAPPKKVVMVPIIWGFGVSKELELFDELVIQGIITKTSSYFTYKDVRLNGKKNMLDYVKANIDEFQAILDKKGVLGGPAENKSTT